MSDDARLGEAVTILRQRGFHDQADAVAAARTERDAAVGLLRDWVRFEPAGYNVPHATRKFLASLTPPTPGVPVGATAPEKRRRRGGRHRWRQRWLGGSPSRYWDCDNDGCGEFCYDMKHPARARMNHDLKWDVPCKSPKAAPL